MTLADYHLHSHVSTDAIGSILEHARSAERLGLAEICFTEHLDFFVSDDGLACTTIPTEGELIAYLEEVREAADASRIPVRAGLEVDYKPETDRWVRELLGRIPFDFLLGSVHNVGAWPVSGPAELARDYLGEKGPESGLLRYFEVAEQAIRTGLFDSFAHLDLLKRFDPAMGELTLRGAVLEKVVAALDLLASTDTGIEVNSAGLVHEPREAYPSLDLLKLARERGVEVLTLGSDSHRPETVGRDLEAASDLAMAAGYARFHTFSSRVSAVRSLS